MRGTCGASVAQQLRRDRLAGERAEAPGEIGCQLRCHPLQLVWVRGRHDLHVGAEAQRVLERVEALQHGEALVPARSLEALRQRRRRRAHATAGASVRGSAASVASRLTAWISSGKVSSRTLRMKPSSPPSGLKKSS